MADRGYDFDWVEDPPDDLKCLICLCVARDPQQHPGDDTNQCGKVFCRECITEHQKTSNKCPNCSRNLTFFPDGRSAKNIKDLIVKCDNENNGCKWTGELGSLETHLQSCNYALVPCTNECKTGLKIAEFLRKDLKQHLAKDCPRRKRKCPRCKETGEHQEMTTTHLDTCPKVRVHCPNTDCGSKILRCNLPTHLSTCQHESVTCKYFALGCNDTPKRKELKTHEEDASLHLKLSIEKNLELTQTVARLEADTQAIKNSQQENLIKFNSHIFRLIKITNYSQYKCDNRAFYSPPFYTSPVGYKMCLLVYANGISRGADTHVSVFAYLMKGDQDDTLTWPFTGSVTFELLNQLEDKNHYKLTFTFSADQEASKRVVERERAQNGWGQQQFISHAALDCNTSTKLNIQYLKDDTLVFRVSVEVPNHKPWLDYIA